MNTRHKIIISIGISVLILSVVALIFSTLSYNMVPYSYVNMQQTCGNFYQPEFISINDDQLQNSVVLLGLKEGITGDLLPTPTYDTKKLLSLVGHAPQQQGEFGVNIDGKSYFVEYLFSSEEIKTTDNVIGCYDTGLIEHYQNNPVVSAFYDRYDNVHSFGRDDHVSFVSNERDSFSASLSLFFDKNFDVTKMSFRCNLYEDDIEYEITKQDEILFNLENSHCLYDKYPHLKISLNEFRSSYSVGSIIDDFTIKLEGFYSLYNAPEIMLLDEAGNLVWTNYNDISHVYSSYHQPVDICKEYRFNDIGGPLMLNSTGTYKFVFSFEEFSLERVFYVRENITGAVLDNPNFGCT